MYDANCILQSLQRTSKGLCLRRHHFCAKFLAKKFDFMACVKSIKKSFQMMYSNLCLSFCETVPLTLYVHFHDRKTNFLKNGWTDFFNEIGKNVIIFRGWGGNQTICLNALLSFTLSVHYATVHTYIYMCTLWYCILITFLNMET